jgi:hypothetical protein
MFRMFLTLACLVGRLRIDPRLALVRRGVCLVLLAIATASGAGQNIANARGVYVYSEHPEKTADFFDVEQALSVPGVDGLTLLVGWSTVEPGLHSDGTGIYAWNSQPQNLLDQLLQEAIQNGKKVDLAIRAGQDTPCWLFSMTTNPCTTEAYAGATELDFLVAAVQGAGTSCNLVPIAAPWDPIFLREWNHMLAAVANHLQNESFLDMTTGQMVVAWDAVVSVRLTGVNRTTAETRLPAEILPSPCTDNQGISHADTNAVAIWLAAGYRPSLLGSAWRTIIGDFAAHFPGKILTMPIIPDGSGNADYPFPQIDENGCIFVPPVQLADFSVPPGIPANQCTNPSFGDDNAPLLAAASAQFPRQVIVAYQSLANGQPAQPYVAVTAPEMFGVMTGFQTNDFISFQRAACSGGTAHGTVCQDAADYLALLEIGIFPTCPAVPQPIPANALCRTNPRSQYIESLPPDVFSTPPSSDANPGFPAAIFQAHAELVDYTPPALTESANPAVLWPPDGRMATVTVAGTISDDLSGVAANTGQFSVEDEYGVIKLHGPISFAGNGSYSFTVSLQASVAGVDLNGRTYTITVSGRDLAGNAGSKVTTVIVPHDQRP